MRLTNVLCQLKFLLPAGTDGDGDGQRREEQARTDALAPVYGGTEAPTRGFGGKVPLDGRVIHECLSFF